MLFRDIIAVKSLKQGISLPAFWNEAQALSLFFTVPPTI